MVEAAKADICNLHVCDQCTSMQIRTLIIINISCVLTQKCGASPFNLAVLIKRICANRRLAHALELNRINSYGL